MKNENVYSVSEATKYLKRLITADPFLSAIAVEGEVSNVTYHKSGHIYFTLKDQGASLSGMMWSSKKRLGLNFEMKEGDRVVVYGNFDLYEPRGTYSIIATRIEKAGVGDLYQKFLALKEELEEMGMFSEEYKSPIPRFAHRIGVVTAPTGAAIQDIIRNAKLQNPSVEIILYPALVQGEGAKESIAAGILALDELDLDVMIVGRGGGSIEDLWAFNEREVAEAIFHAKTPIISAVGHETDTTIADFVADLRVATPTEAAKKACFSLDDLRDDFYRIEKDLNQKLEYRFNQYHMRLSHFEDGLKARSPEARIKAFRMKIQSLTNQLNFQISDKMTGLRNRMAVLAASLDGKSPAKKLSGGYSYVTATDGKRLESVSQVKTGDDLHLYLKKGELMAQVTKVLDE